MHMIYVHLSEIHNFIIIIIVLLLQCNIMMYANLRASSYSVYDAFILIINMSPLSHIYVNREPIFCTILRC